MSVMAAEDRATLLDSLRDSVSTLDRLGEYLVNGTASISDVEVSVSREEEIYCDLGEFGESSTYKEIEIETTTDVEVDVSDILESNGPSGIYSGTVRDDILPIVQAALDLIERGDTGSTSTARATTLDERRGARACLALLGSLLDSPSEIEQSLRFALDTLPVSTSVPEQSLDPLSFPLGSTISTTMNDIRLGDDITGESYGRLVEVIRVSDGLVTYVLDRDGDRRTRTDRLDQSWSIRQIAPLDRSRSDYPPAVAGR